MAGLLWIKEDAMSTLKLNDDRLLRERYYKLEALVLRSLRDVSSSFEASFMKSLPDACVSAVAPEALLCAPMLLLTSTFSAMLFSNFDAEVPVSATFRFMLIEFWLTCN